jgi:hypothetical protein
MDEGVRDWDGASVQHGLQIQARQDEWLRSKGLR